MSGYESSKQTIYDNTLDIIRKGHDTGDRKADTLRTEGVEKLLEFFYKETDENAKIPYQYDVKNQSPFYHKPALRIADAMGYVIPTLSKIQSNLWITSRTNQMLDTLESEQQSIQQQRTAMLSAKQVAEDVHGKTGIIDRLVGSLKQKPKTTFNINDPYNFWLKMYRVGIGIIDNWKLVSEYQSYAVRVLPTFFDREGFDEYMKYHIAKFEFEVAQDLLRTFREYLILKME